MVVLNSPAYRDRLNGPTAWTQEIMPSLRGMNRTPCRIDVSIGIGRAMLGCRLAPRPHAGEALRRVLRSTLDGLKLGSGLVSQIGMPPNSGLVPKARPVVLPDQTKRIGRRPSRLMVARARLRGRIRPTAPGAVLDARSRGGRWSLLPCPALCAAFLPEAERRPMMFGSQVAELPMASAIQTIAHSSGHGSWTLWRRLPAPALRGWLLEYQGYLETGGWPVRRRELPVPVIPLILNLGAPFFSYEIARPQRTRRLARSFTAGLHRRYAVVGSTGRAHCLQVDMTPLAARRLFGVPMADLTDGIVELDDLDVPWLRGLTGRLAELPDWPSRFALVDARLGALLAAAAPASPLVALAWRRLEATCGRASVAGVAAALEVSRTRLHRLFLDQVGLPPKTTARLFRFKAAVDAIQRGERLADLAAAAGYFDQPHFNRECVEFAGESPTGLRRRLLADATGLMDGPA